MDRPAEKEKEDGEMKKYHIRVSQTKYPDYPCFTFYDIEMTNYHDAEREARRRFCLDYGFAFKDTEAYTFDKHIIDYRYSIAPHDHHR